MQLTKMVFIWIDSMSWSVSVNQKCVTKEYSNLIKLQMCEDPFPLNARMTECAIERNKICEDQLVRIGLSADFRWIEPVDVCKRELLVKTGKKMRIYLQKTQRYGALRMTTISNRWPHVGHCRLVFPRSFKWRKLMRRHSFQFFSHITRHSYHRMSQNIVLDDLGWFWAVSERFSLEMRLLRAFKAAIEQIKCTFANWCLFVVFMQPGTQSNVCFLRIFDSTTNRIDSETLC